MVQVRVACGARASRQNGEVRVHSAGGEYEEDRGGRSLEETDDQGRHRAPPVGTRAHHEAAAARGAQRTIRVGQLSLLTSAGRSVVRGSDPTRQLTDPTRPTTSGKKLDPTRPNTANKFNRLTHPNLSQPYFKCINTIFKKYFCLAS